MNTQERQQLLSIAAQLTAFANSLNDRTETRGRKPSVRTPSRARVPYAVFHHLLRQKYPHSRTGHGAKRAFLEYAAKDQQAITEALEQKWRRDHWVPRWVYNYLLQIRELPARAPKTEWSYDEIDFLNDIILRYPTENYDRLAERCTRKFGRPISETHIKGVTFRHRFGKNSS